MAFGKALLLLCLGLLVASQAKTVNLEINGIIEQAEKLLEELRKTLEGAISTALKTIKGFVSEIAAAAAEFIKELNETLVAAIGPFVKQIQNAVSAAAQAGIDVAECTGDSIEEIEDLPDQLIRNVTSCVADKVNEANDVINGFISDISNTTNVILDIGNQIKKCENGGILNLAICLAGVTAKISSEMVTLPIQITQDVLKAKAYILEVIPSFTACDLETKAALILRAGAIATNVTGCVQEKINGGRSSTAASGDSSTTAGSISSSSGSDDE